MQKYAQDLQIHPNVTINTYEISMDESGLRRKGKIANRETGIESVKDVFGMPWHSHVILQDQELQRRIKVTCNCL